jgi:hypothetical protein
MSARSQNKRQRAHADAADADKMHAARPIARIEKRVGQGF